MQSHLFTPASQRPDSLPGPSPPPAPACLLAHSPSASICLSAPPSLTYASFSRPPVFLPSLHPTLPRYPSPRVPKAFRSFRLWPPSPGWSQPNCPPRPASPAAPPSLSGARSFHAPAQRHRWPHLPVGPPRSFIHTSVRVCRLHREPRAALSRGCPVEERTPPGLPGASWERGKEEAEGGEGREGREGRNGALAASGGTDVARPGFTELFPARSPRCRVARLESDEFQHQLISL